MLLMSSTFIAAGAFTAALGIVHLWIPTIVRDPVAIGDDAGQAALGAIGRGLIRPQLRRRDLLGITWIMSNAASDALMSIGLLDVAWGTGWTSAPPAILVWVAGWWAVRAVGQLAIGRRRGDVVVAAWLWILCAIHLAPVIAVAA